MGFPDPYQVQSVELPAAGVHQRFVIPVSDTQAYRQFGNSVVVPVIRHLAVALVSQIGTGASLAAAS